MSGTYRPTWTQIVTDLSNEVVSLLALAGLPPLTPEIDGSPGRIQIGPQFVAEHGSPPRILMIPREFPFENSRDVVSPTGRPLNNLTWPTRAIGVQWKTYEVQCWGCDFTSGLPTPDPALDYDAAQGLAEIVWQAAQALAAGVWRTTRGKVDQSPALIRLGHVFTFDLALSTPAPDIPIGYVPIGTKANATTKISINGGSPVGPGG